MIIYDTGPIGIFFVLRISGSVLPKGLLWGIPSVALTAYIHAYFPYLPLLDGFENIWGGYTFVLGFLLSFRNNQAFNRFWEGATLLHQIQGEWLSAVSSVFAFCSTETEQAEQVYQYQHLVVRLMSMLHCQALQLICDLDDDALEIIDVTGLSEDSLSFLSRQVDRCQVLMQWLQRSIVQAEKAGTIKIAPPILSRAFQELSRGLVNLNNVRKIKKIPFPYPYAQILQVMLMAYWTVTPFLAAHLCRNIYVACCLSFCTSTAFWSLIYIANEIDNPFGDDANDFNLEEMQQEMGTMSQVRHRLWSLPHLPMGSHKGRRGSAGSAGDGSNSTSPGRMRMSQVIRSFGAAAFSTPQTVVVDAPRGDSFAPGQARSIKVNKSFPAVHRDPERRSLDSLQSKCSEEIDAPMLIGNGFDPTGRHVEERQYQGFGIGRTREISGNSDVLSSVPLGRVEEDLQPELAVASRTLSEAGSSVTLGMPKVYSRGSKEQLEEDKVEKGVGAESQAQTGDDAPRVPVQIETAAAPTAPRSVAEANGNKESRSRSGSPGEKMKGSRSSVREGLESALASLTCRIEEKKRPSQPRVEALQVDSAPNFPKPQTRPSLLVGPVIGVNVDPRRTDQQLLLDLPGLDGKRGSAQAASGSNNGGRLSPVPERLSGRSVQDV